MAFFNLIARLGLDSSGFQTGVKQAENVAVGFGNRLEKKLGRKLEQAFGIGAIASGIIHAAQRISELAKEGDKLDGLANRFHVTTAEVLALQRAAEETGESLAKLATKGPPTGVTESDVTGALERRMAQGLGLHVGLGELMTRGFELFLTPLLHPKQFVKDFGGKLGIGPTVGVSGDALDVQTALAERQKERLPIIEKLREAQRKLYLDSLDPAEKLLALEKERDRLIQARPVGAQEPWIDEAKRLTSVAQIEDQIQALKKRKLGKADSQSFPEFESMDSLARIGGFTGGAQHQLLSLQQRIARATEGTEAAVSNQP